MYFGEHAIRFYPDEESVGLHTFMDSEQPDGCPHTWKDWHLIPTGEVLVQPPATEQNLLKIPGRHGLVDLNKYTFGRPVYDNRQGAITFRLDKRWLRYKHVIHSEIMRYLHGQERMMVLRDDRFYYYRGTFTVSELPPDERGNFVTIGYDLEPFKYERFTSGDPPQLWDDFNFLTGVLRDYNRIVVSGVAGTETTREIVDRNSLFGTDDVPEIKGDNTSGVMAAATAEGAPLHAMQASLDAVPIAVESSDYTTAYLIKEDGQTDRDVLTSQAFATVIFDLTTAAAVQSMNAALAEETKALTDILTELKDTASAQDTSDEDLAMLLGNVLPGAYFQTQWILTVAQHGIVQARVGTGDWINVFDANAESYIDLAVGGDLARRFLYLRTTIDTTGLYLNDEKIDPLVTVSVRGNSL